MLGRLWNFSCDNTKIIALDGSNLERVKVESFPNYGNLEKLLYRCFTTGPSIHAFTLIPNSRTSIDGDSFLPSKKEERGVINIDIQCENTNINTGT